MEPRIESEEYVLINALAYRFAQPERGDIVAFRHERTGQSLYLKRVIGLPGDRIEIDRGAVRVNGATLPEPYVRYADGRSFAGIVVPPDGYYVLGDNRPESDDSRAFGVVLKRDLVGRAMFAIWPPAHVGAVR
jgi:signal peptidase I